MREDRPLAFMVLMVMTVLLLPVGPAVSSDAVTATVPIRWVEAPRSGEPVPGASQTTRATAKGTSMEVVTNGLLPGQTYTLWFAFFNHPENCLFPPNLPDTTLRCGFLDLFNPATDGNFIYGDGLVAEGTEDVFRAFVATGESPAGARECNGLGQCADEQVAFAWEDDDIAILTDPLTAEYQATLRNHGPEDDEFMPAQITTHNGGCHEGEPYHPCRDDQSSGLRVQAPLECFEEPACLLTLYTSETPFVIGDGSGKLGEDRIRVNIAARRYADGRIKGKFAFWHFDPEGELITSFNGHIDCLRTTSTVAYATGVIKSAKRTGDGINPKGEPVAITVADRDMSDVVTFNIPFATGVPITEPCQEGIIPLATDGGNYIVAH